MAKIIYINPKKKAFISLLITIILVCSSLYMYEKYTVEDVPVFAAELKSSNAWFGIVKNVLGFSMSINTPAEPFLDKMLSEIAQTDITEPKRMIARQMLATSGKEEWYITEPEHEELVIPVPKPEKQVEEIPPVQKPISGKPLVGIYSTHNAETYSLSDGVDKIEGKNAGVAKAAESLRKALEAKGIGVIHDQTIHDYPDWAKSYSNSLKTTKKLMKDYPSIQILIDIHRDAMPSRENSITKVDGKNVAKLSFIVGSDTRLQHPNWKKNWAYANFLAEKAEQSYPGLFKTVRVQSGRYNQHVSTHSILIEVGSTQNSVEEAERSMELFAEVLAESIAEKR